NGKSAEQNTYDAIVVGSGISGGWAAKELTEKGLKVLMLDRGWELKHGQYETAMKHPWEFKYAGKITQKQREENPYLSRDYPFNEYNAHYWFKDVDSPYEEEKRFDWFRGNIVGGKSIMWGRHSYRLADIDFEANLKDGIAVDWPIRYKDLAPWYDYVESFAGISGEPLGLPHLPDSQFLPPMELNCVEKHVKKRLEKEYPGRYLTIGRVAHATKPINGRGPCQFFGRCDRGCPFGGYFSSNSATLPAAGATGNLTFRPYSIVH